MASAPQNPTEAIDAMGAVTTVHLVLLALLALAAVLTIWWGSVLYRRRKTATRQVRENYETAEAHGATCEPTESTPGAETATISADVPDNVPAVGETPVATDLTQIKGLGPKLAATLAEHGVTRVDQIAGLSQGDADALDAKLGTFRGRMARDRWIEQAKLLAAGDRAGYEAVFGKLGG